MNSKPCGRYLCGNKKCEGCVSVSLYPILKRKPQFAWSKENNIKPWQVRCGANTKYKFLCTKEECGHEFEDSPNNMKTKNCCSYCSSAKPANLCDLEKDCKICFNRSFAGHPKAKYISKNNNIDPRTVYRSGNNILLFSCEVCNHEFDARCNDVTSGGNWCPYCVHKRLCDTNCKICIQNTFSSNPLSVYWSEENDTTPDKVFSCSNKKYKFDCPECKHSFEADLNNINKGKWCPYCAHKKLCKNVDCSYCSNNRFLSQDKAKFYIDDEDITQIFIYSNNKYKFKCNECCHEFKISPEKISSGKWCPYCARKKLCKNIDCNYCSNNSFLTHPKALYWSPKNELLPRQVAIYSHKRCIFDCPDCKNEYISEIRTITYEKCWCPCTKNKTEAKFLEYLKQLDVKTISDKLTEIKVEHQAKFDWCKNKLCLPFDFHLILIGDNLEKKIINELDGNQHFEQVQNWQSPEKRQNIDIFKMEKCIENNISIIRLYQPSVFYDNEDWKERFVESLKYIIDEETIKVIYIGKKYEQFDAYMNFWKLHNNYKD